MQILYLKLSLNPKLFKKMITYKNSSKTVIYSFLLNVLIFILHKCAIKYLFQK